MWGDEAMARGPKTGGSADLVAQRRGKSHGKALEDGGARFQTNSGGSTDVVLVVWLSGPCQDVG